MIDLEKILYVRKLVILTLLMSLIPASYSIANSDEFYQTIDEATPGFHRVNIEIGPSAIPAGSSCDTNTIVHVVPEIESSGTQDHLSGSGKHGLKGQGDWKCSCTLACVNTCTPQMKNLSCFESGGNHQTSGTSLSQTQDSDIANATSCSSSASCTISTMDTNPLVLLTATINTSGACAACDEIDIPSPIVMNLKGNPLTFTGQEDSVLFDMDGDGIKEDIGWTERNSATVFLVLDRNGNGTIDDGAELFGNHTPQPEAPSKNGYLALKEFDDNNDDFITEDDREFQFLQLWNDRNHNGISERSELVPVHRRLQSIGVEYIPSDRQDDKGNVLSIFSTATKKNSREIVTVDVTFVTVIRH